MQGNDVFAPEEDEAKHALLLLLLTWGAAHAELNHAFSQRMINDT